MKLIILDHFRRRAWTFALGAIIQLALGWGQAAFAARGRDDPLAVLQFQIGVFMGAFLLSLDLQRGIARTLATLPLSLARLGRAWWLATVAIPAAGFIALLLLGTALFHVFHPAASIAWDQLVISAATLLLTLGASFTLVFKMNAGFATGTGWQRVINIAFGVLWGLLIGGGFLIVQNPENHPVRLIVFLLLGVGLTVVGGLQAGAFAADRAGFRPSPETKAQNTSAQSTGASGALGGLSLLVVQTTSRAFLMGLAMLVLPPLFLRFQGHTASWLDALRNTVKPGSSPFWFVLIVALTPALLQLRYLRTLPLSSGRLAVALLTMLLLPLLALGALSVALCGSLLGSPAALATAQGHFLTLIPAALVIAFVAWRGLGMAAYVLVITCVMVGQFSVIWLHTGKNAPSLPLGLTTALAAVVIVAAFFLTRLALERSPHVYRASVGGAFGRAWGMGR